MTIEVIRLLEKQHELNNLRIQNKINKCEMDSVGCSPEDHIAYMTASAALKELRVELIEDFIEVLKLLTR
jgi:hypothetical protein